LGQGKSGRRGGNAQLPTTRAAICAREPDLLVRILSGFPEEHCATTLQRRGARGYLNKDCDPDEIVRAIRPRVMEKVCLASNSDLTYYALNNRLIQ
jgi:ActR/RegA family two-component response regulator